jgi:dUTP pyrophosphatase
MRLDKVKITLKEGAKLPTRATDGSVGYDLYSLHRCQVAVGEVALISTGVSIELPHGYEAQIRARSGLSTKGLALANGTGTIDSDYRGVILLPMIVLCGYPYTIIEGQRIAQMIINKVELPIFTVVDELGDTKRKDGGFGHTGE